MARKASGSLEWMRNKVTGKMQWHARFSRGPGAKPRRTPYIAIEADLPEHDRAGALAAAARWAPKARAVPAKGTGETVEAYGARWLDDREGRVHSIRDDRSRMRDHVFVRLAPLDVRTFTRDDVEQLRDELDKKITRAIYADG